MVRWHFCADGLHMGSHAVALSINAFAYIYARRHAHDNRFSFGTGKVNTLGGFTGAVLLAGFAFAMVIESIDRFVSPVPIEFNQAIFVAALGLIVNGVSVLILGHSHDPENSDARGHDHSDQHLHHHHHHDHNLISAYLHVLADALTSLLAIFALLAAKYFGFIWAIGPKIYSAAIAVVTSNPLEPDAYKQRIPKGLGIVHTNIEVHSAV